MRSWTPGVCGEVAGGAVLGRHGEDVPARAEHRPRAVRARRRSRSWPCSTSRQPAAADGEVFADLDRHLHRLFGGEVEAVDVPAVLEHDGLVAQRRELHGELGELRELAGRLGLQVIDEQVGLAVRRRARRRNRCGRPRHIGKMSCAGSSVSFVGGLLLEIVEPDFVRLAAAIAFPGAELAEDAVVGQLLAVGREGAPAAARQRAASPARRRPAGQRQFALERIPLVRRER